VRPFGVVIYAPEGFLKKENEKNARDLTIKPLTKALLIPSS